MKQDFSKLSRRSVLRGIGISMALPALESFRPLLAAGGGNQAVGTTASGAPLRMAYLYIPNGVHVGRWRPDGTNSGYKMRYSPNGRCQTWTPK